MMLLVDADILTYRIGFAVQKKVGNDLEVEPIHHAYYLIKKQIKKMVDDCKADSFKLFLTSNDHSNYRFKLAKTLKYKGNRLQAKPHYYNELRDYMIDYYNAEVVFDKEADDAMGTYQYNSDKTTAICSIDKDMLMIPGWHYNIATGQLAKYEDPGELYPHKAKILGGGLKWFYAQMLMGDTADNIPGIPGVGPKKAFKILNELKNEEEFYKAVKKVYTEHKAVDRFDEVADLLFIQRQDGQKWTDRAKEIGLYDVE